MYSIVLLLFPMPYIDILYMLHSRGRQVSLVKSDGAKHTSGKLILP